MSYNDNLVLLEEYKNNGSCKIIVISGKKYSGRTTLANFIEKYSLFKKIDFDMLTKIYPNKDYYYCLDKIIELSKSQPIVFPYLETYQELQFFKENNAFTIRLETSDEIRLQRSNFLKTQDIIKDELDNINYWNWIYYNNGSLDDLKDLAVCISKLL